MFGASVLTLTSVVLAHEPSALETNGILYHEQTLVKPFFAGDGISIPNWDFIGNSVVTDDYIRLTPDRQTKKGAIWNLKPMPAESWEMTTEFKVTGQGTSLFGDGFALWYTKERGVLGTALGNVESFTGLGIFFDTYDNHQEDHGHPWISAILNDGTKVYDHDEDGKSFTQGGCQSFFRNLETRTFVRVSYWADLKFLKVEVDVADSDEWTSCFELNDVHLSAGNYFGASASTGDLADNHDIVSIKIGSAPPPSEAVQASVKEYNDKKSKTVGSIEAGKQMNQHHMDESKIVSNHRERHRDQEMDEGGMGWMSIVIVIILVLGVIGGVVYFGTQSNNKKFDY